MSIVRLEVVVTIEYNGDEQVAIHAALGAIEGTFEADPTSGDVTVDTWEVYP